jgi:DNA-binding response OmpR family regulator
VDTAAARILIVEDQDNIRALLAEALVHDGYEVSEAADRASALRWLAENGDVSAVVLDWILDGSPADDVLRAIVNHPARPGCVLTSGYRLAPPMIATDRVVMVAKPFTQQMIRQALAALGV